MKRHIFSFLLALAAGIMSLNASTAAFKRIWIETNVTHNGEKGIMIHADFDLNDAKDKTVECQAIFYASPGGRALRDLNGKYRISPSLNYVSSSSFFKAKTNAMDVDDCTVFIPSSELHLKNPRKYRIYVKMSVYTNPGKTGEFLVDSDYIPFVVDMTDQAAPGSRFDFDPTQPKKPLPQKEVKKDAPAPLPEKSVTPAEDEPQYDKKGRMKPRKRKVFIS
ncbi:MAG: hypothetical protein NC421_00165 [Lachnospiraceae bacterium]|nr:hypothetical protein [Lachnospiraceae bacterium]